MSTPIRVLQLLPLFSVGGAEVLVMHLASAASSGRFAPYVCALFDRGVRALRPDFEKLGVPVHCLNGPRLYSAKTHLLLVKYVREHNIDIIHTHLLPADISGRFVGRMLGIPVVSTLHSIPRDFSRERPDRRWLERVTAKHLTDQVVTIADFVRAKFVDEWHFKPNQIEVIYNAIPVEHYTSVPEDPIRSHGETGLVITTIARLIPLKAHDVLIEAAKRVLARYPSTRFMIVGEGSEKERILAKAHANGIADRVQLTGIRRDIPDILAQSDIFVLPSHYEGLPMSVIEAMAAARPVVVTDVGGNRELVTHGIHGLVVPPGDPVGLASALLELIEHPERRREMGRRGRERACEHFGLNTMMKQHEAIYERLVVANRQRMASRVAPIGE